MAEPLSSTPNQDVSVRDLVSSTIKYQQETLARQQYQQEIQSSGPVKFGADLISQTLFGKTAAELRASPSLTDQVLGHAAPMISAYAADAVGWSPSAMIMANQNLFAQGGLRVADVNGQNAMTLNGYGRFADQLAQESYKGIESRFFHPLGAPNMDTTYGASRDDIGAIIQDLQRRGTFSGQQAGTYETLTPERLSQLRNDARSSGNQAAMKELETLSSGELYVTPDASLGARVGDWIQNTAKAVQELRGVIGNFKPQEIISELERLTGVDVARPGQIESGMNQIRQRVAFGTGAGLDARQSLELGYATTSTLDAMLAGRTGSAPGSFAGVAAPLGLVADKSSYAAWLEQKAAGGYRSLPEIMSRTAGDMSALLVESPEMVESLVAASSASGASRKALLDSVEAYRSAGTAEQRERVRADMARTYEQVTGKRSGAEMGINGMSGMLDYLNHASPDLVTFGGDVLNGTSQSAMINDFRRITGMDNASAKFNNALGGPDKAAQFAMEMFQAVQPAQMQSIIQSIGQTGGTADAVAILRGAGVNSLPSFGDVGTALGSANRHITGAYGGTADLGDFLTRIQDSMSRQSAFASFTSNAGEKDMSVRAGRQYQVMMENNGMNSVTPMQSLEQGLFGGVIPLEDRALIKYAEAEKDKVGFLKFNKQGTGFDVDKAGVDALSKQFARQGIDIYSAMGVKVGDEAALIAELGKDGAAAKLGPYMTGKGSAAMLGEDADGAAGIKFLQDPEGTRKRYADDLKKRTGVEKAPSRSVTFILQLPGGLNIPITGTMKE